MVRPDHLLSIIMVIIALHPVSSISDDQHYRQYYNSRQNPYGQGPAPRDPRHHPHQQAPWNDQPVPAHRGLPQAPADLPYGLMLIGTFVLAVVFGSLIDPNRMPTLPSLPLISGVQWISSWVLEPWFGNGKLSEFMTGLVVLAVFTGACHLIYRGPNDDDDVPRPIRPPAQFHDQGPARPLHDGSGREPAADGSSGQLAVMAMISAILIMLLLGRRSAAPDLIVASVKNVLMVMNLLFVVRWLFDYERALPIRGLLHIMAFVCARHPAGDLFVLVGTAYGLFDLARTLHRYLNGPIDY